MGGTKGASGAAERGENGKATLDDLLENAYFAGHVERKNSGFFA